MAVDPRIALMGRGVDVGGTFSNILNNVSKMDDIKKQRAMLPLEEQLKQAQIANQQQVLTSNELSNNKVRQDQYLSSVAQAGAEILPALNSGDIEGVRGSLTRRLGELQAQGQPTETTQEALMLLDSNPQLLKQRAEQAVQLGKDRGLFGGIARSATAQRGQARTVRKGDQLVSQQEIFNPNTGTVEVIETPIEGDLVQSSTGLTAQERIDMAGDKQRVVGDIKVGQDITAAGGKETVKLNVQKRLRPQVEKAIVLAKKQAESQGDTFNELQQMNAALPSMKEVVSQLKALTPLSTSTFGGKAFDTASKELGFGATKGSTARAKYIAIVDNELLPLLRQTFGSAFTEEEGNKLKATLGDPDATPEARNAQLDAFMESKERQIKTKERELGVDSALQQQENQDKPAGGIKFLGFE